MNRSSVWWLSVGRGLALLTLVGGGLVVHAGPQTATDCRAAEPVPWQAVAPGVWVWLPPGAGDVSPANAGHVEPSSVVISGREAMVIDPGPSHRHGLRLRQSIACRFKASVRWIVNTHAHSENVLANSAFADLAANGRVDILATARQRRQNPCVHG